MESYSLYNGEVTLTYEPRRHIYRVDGKVVDGVTSVGKVLDAPGLNWWRLERAYEEVASRLQEPGFEVNEITIDEMRDVIHKAQYKRTAASIGTHVHHFAEAHMKYLMGEGEKPGEPKHAEVWNGAAAFLRWIKQIEVKPMFIERKLYSRTHNYAGTTDLIGVIGGVQYVIDYKTSKDIYDEYRMQLSAYVQAWEEENGARLRRMIIIFPKDGGEPWSRDLDEDGVSTHEEDLGAFLDALNLRRWKMKLERIRRKNEA